MDMESPKPGTGSKPGTLIRVLRVLGGYHLACILILLLGVLTWLGTLEQVALGLYEVKKKYFSSESVSLWAADQRQDHPPAPAERLLGGGRVLLQPPAWNHPPRALALEEGQVC